MPAALEAIAKMQQIPPTRLISCGDTQIIPWYHTRPWDWSVPALDRHIVVTHVKVDGDAPVFTRSGGREVRGLRRPGTMSVSPSGRDRWSRAVGEAISSTVMISARRLDLCSEALGRWRPVELIDRSCVEDPTIFALLALLAEEAHRKDALPRVFFDQLVDLFCLQLLRAHASEAGHQVRRLNGGLAGWQVKRVTDYIQDNLCRDVSLQELANLVGLSRYHFCNAFKLATGVSPYAWLLKLRIRKAKALLANTAMPISDVARALGYSSSGALTHAFRRMVGRTPVQFRKSL